MDAIKMTILLLFFGTLFTSCSNFGSNSINSKTVLDSISDKMEEQENCWNSGDLTCFMQYYWHSDSLIFIGRSGLTYGWQKTLDNYIESYPDKSAMGKLTFTNEVIKFIDIKTVQVIGGARQIAQLGIEK